MYTEIFLQVHALIVVPSALSMVLVQHPYARSGCEMIGVKENTTAPESIQEVKSPPGPMHRANLLRYEPERDSSSEQNAK